MDSNPVYLVKRVEEFSSESIWIGKMNYIPKMDISNHIGRAFKEIRKIYSAENIMKIYFQLNDNPLIRWKDSIRNILIKNGIFIKNYSSIML